MMVFKKLEQQVKSPCLVADAPLWQRVSSDPGLVPLGEGMDRTRDQGPGQGAHWPGPASPPQVLFSRHVLGRDGGHRPA